MKNETKFGLYRVGFWISGILVFLVGILLTMNTPMERGLGLVALFSIIALTGNFYEHLGLAKKTKDERLAQIAIRSMSYSWYLTLITILLTIEVTGILDLGLSMSQILGLGLMVMIATMVLSNELLVRFGGVEQ